MLASYSWKPRDQHVSISSALRLEAGTIIACVFCYRFFLYFRILVLLCMDPWNTARLFCSQGNALPSESSSQLKIFVIGAGAMAQWFRALPAHPEDMGSSSITHS